ncbi:MAG: hypothetical protein RL885_23425 [Planctomycetota bacterium]
MSTTPRDPLIEAVHEALDARRPPLGDDRVRELLAQQPERLGEILEMLTCLDRLVEDPVAPARRLRVAAAIAAVLLMVGLAVWLSWDRGVSQGERKTPPEVSAPEPSTDLGRILTWKMEIVTERPGKREVLRRDEGRLQREIVSAPVRSPEDDEGWARASLALSTERRLSE